MLSYNTKKKSVSEREYNVMFTNIDHPSAVRLNYS